MASHALSVLALAGVVAAQSSSALTWAPTPLVSLSFPKPTDAPPKVWPDLPAYERGPQTGYNQCNSTTEGSNSLCQTAYVNDLSDFCLWAPATPNSLIADTEGDEVAWCTKAGYGTRQIPAGALLGAQMLKNNDYIMITGLVDQSKINIQSGDAGGELDSGSQDGRGNPIGGLVYSTNFDPSTHQVNWWTQFIGNGQFCIKICNPASNNESGYCQHTLDRIGLSYNCPSKYTIGGSFQAGEFEVCDTADMVVPGEYTDASGATQSYSQPPESLGEISTIPFAVSTAVASSNCKQTPSAQLFAGAPAATGSGSASGSGSGAPTATGSGSGAPTATGSGSGAPTATGTGKPTGTASNTAKTPAPTNSGSNTAGAPSSTPSGKGNGAGRAAAAGTAGAALLAAVAFVAFL